uniref:Uncharacterized protein n=1 Tax=Vespula pensylvanica TaxID=30213 RepID=A0A834UDR0_VESPE|nr:hypothetical protein H0235_002390 [Vespula pensylvanica]
MKNSYVFISTRNGILTLISVEHSIQMQNALKSYKEYDPIYSRIHRKKIFHYGFKWWRFKFVKIKCEDGDGAIGEGLKKEVDYGLKPTFAFLLPRELLDNTAIKFLQCLDLGYV